MIILVCGGRTYSDVRTVDSVLSRGINPGDPLTVVIQGGAPGADRLAKEWCHRNRVHCAQVDALWDAFKHSAGPRRNTVMLVLQPEIVIAFPGGKGTANMVAQARERGVRVLEVA